MKKILGTLAAVAALAFAASGVALAAAGDAVKVIYHINEGNEQATDGLRNANNHLKADPKAKIVFVTHSKGIRFLLDGAKDANNSPYDAIVQDLMGRGVEFRLCAFTLERGKIDKNKVIQGVKIVPSGVAEVSRLQAQEGYVYLKP
ncbi:MAG: DsrE family protein [Burkholderiales bacterium]